MYVILGMAIGVAVGIVVCLFMSYLENRPKKPEEMPADPPNVIRGGFGHYFDDKDGSLGG